jgi:hypothetical protein
MRTCNSHSYICKPHLLNHIESSSKQSDPTEASGDWFSAVCRDDQGISLCHEGPVRAAEIVFFIIIMMDYLNFLTISILFLSLLIRSHAYISRIPSPRPHLHTNNLDTSFCVKDSLFRAMDTKLYAKITPTNGGSMDEFRQVKLSRILSLEEVYDVSCFLP